MHPFARGKQDAFECRGKSCDIFGVVRAIHHLPRVLVITLLAAKEFVEVVPVGEAAPDVVQFFEAYAPEDGVCQWQPF